MPKKTELMDTCNVCGRSRPENQLGVIWQIQNGPTKKICAACEKINIILHILRILNTGLRFSGEINPKFLAALESACNTLDTWTSQKKQREVNLNKS